MTQKLRVLWIEDGATYDLSNLAAPVFMDGRYDLVIAENASDGIARVLENAFDAIIVDIRIPPGGDPGWIQRYKISGGEKVSTRLGLHLLYTLLGYADSKISLGDSRPTWITPAKIGVLTVESRPELDADLTKLGIKIYQQKRSDVSDEILLELIQKILAQSAHGDGGKE